jgi:hypothetical protein
MMTSPIFEAVLLLTEQLTSDEKRELVARLLKEERDPNDLTQEEFELLLDSMILPGAPGPLFSDSREDWYGMMADKAFLDTNIAHYQRKRLCAL